MKNIYQKLLLAASAMLILLPMAVFGSSQITEDGAILIHHVPDTPPGNPRGIPVVIEASLDTVLSCVCVSLSNAGDSVTVEINNDTSGESTQYVIAGNGPSVLPFSCTVGAWTITFTLMSGDVYEGEFLI